MSEDEEDKTVQPSAVALEYDGSSAPRITAKGRGEIAQRILALAEENEIPLHEDPDLVTLLSQLELGMEIPTNLYVAVAEVLAFTYMMSGKSSPLDLDKDQSES
jgi:flagellar biosynthesis protein